MRIAFTHNLQRTSAEAEAEFDTPETVAAISEALGRLGHEVIPIDVSVPASELVARLELLAPDLVFNTAEGRVGRSREAFYPALFEQLGIPFTGSDAYTCTVTLDKHLSKLVVSERGVPTPGWALVERPGDPIPDSLRFPLIVKPNFEGSSKGITADSVVHDRAALERRLATMLAAYPEGVLVEEFIVGKDYVVPFIEGVSPETGGVLAVAEYEVGGEAIADLYAIYGYELKHERADSVGVRTPARLPEETSKRLMAYGLNAIRALSIRDLGRVDFRVTPDGGIYFIEINALPSLEPGAAIYESAALAGLRDIDATLGAVIASALERYPGLPPRPRRRAKRIRVGLIYNLKRLTPQNERTDRDAEYDAPATIDLLSDVLADLGHEVVGLEAGTDLLRRIEAADIDVAFNIAEGIRGRAREALVPAILDHLDIPFTGSDAATMALTLDKALAKRVVRQAGIPTPDWTVMTSGRERLPAGLSFPVIVKPVAEGSSKGVVGSSVARDEAELRQRVKELTERYQQGALVEAFLPGREFTVALLGNGRPRVLPPMEIIFNRPDEPYPVYGFKEKLDAGTAIRYQVPAEIDPQLGRQIEQTARRAHQALGCRDVARVDLRLDAQGRVHFIECNPLPGLTPGWSDLCLIAESNGMEYKELIRAILAPALRRHRQQLREARRAQARARGRGGGKTAGTPGAADLDPSGDGSD